MNNCYSRGAKRNILDDMITQGLKEFAGLQTELVNPKVNIYENEDAFNVEMMAPGLKKDDFNIQSTNDVLTISYKKDQEAEQNDKKYLKRSFRINSFKRSFQLPENANPEHITAKYEDGILYLNIAKTPDSAPYVNDIKVA